MAELPKRTLNVRHCKAPPDLRNTMMGGIVGHRDLPPCIRFFLFPSLVRKCSNVPHRHLLEETPLPDLFADEQVAGQRLGDLTRALAAAVPGKAHRGGELQMGQVWGGEGGESPWPRPLSSLPCFTILHSVTRVTLEWMPGPPLLSLSLSLPDLSLSLSLSISVSVSLSLSLPPCLPFPPSYTDLIPVPWNTGKHLVHPCLGPHPCSSLPKNTLLSLIATDSAPHITQPWLP